MCKDACYHISGAYPGFFTNNKSLVGHRRCNCRCRFFTDKKMNGLWEALGRSLGSISWACSLQMVGRNDHAPDGLLHSNSLHL